ncbi:UDP-4-amino-4,6-dideoxy-N-acetyl-beta-L-altrosamine transaminase [Gayadomonas joobiniege]|uniref:UDP-4-amino-4, 6-dideoxy-N-acetyl-beta-L-altrosamine transaminase n=1 Tax=Gayadomonas joobiniege TaxID=1234606 RepID=UPI0003622D85|nr:UDP-4-amino-4,6-dideoxy-N-acetyl-beta-L-altrosamine transaminase [Gayadomonas joobiniege]
MIPYGKHQIENDDIEAVVDVLENQFITQGLQVPAFEEALTKYTGAAYALAVNSATSALHVACKALNVGPGDWVWTTPITFVATANAARFCGAQVDFVDIEPSSRNICAKALLKKLIQAEHAGTLPKVLIAVHFAGASCDMQTLKTLCDQYGVKLIEDACHALGGDYQNHKIGSCRFSDFTIFSFHPVKSITTGEGGAVLSNSEALIKKAALFAKHGVTKDPELLETPLDGPWSYQQVELGFNYRMSDLQAALGISQLNKLNAFIARRRHKAFVYHGLLADLPIQLPNADMLEQSAWHLYAIEVDAQQRLPLYEHLWQHGVQVNVHYSPVHLQPYYRRLGFSEGDFPHAEAYAAKTLTLPLFPAMTDAEQNAVANALRSWYQ